MMTFTLLLLLSAACLGGLLLALLLYFVFRRPKAEDGWQVFAARHGLVYSANPRLVTGEYRGRELRLESFSSFNPFGADTYGTQLSLSVKNSSGWRLTIETGAGAGRIGKIFGVPEVKLGDEELDKKYTFRAEPPDLVARLLRAPSLRQYLLTTKQYVKLTLENETLSESPLDVIMESDRLLNLANWLCSVGETLEALEMPASNQ